MADFKHRTSAKGGSFYYEENGKQLGEMVYVMAGPSKMIIEHTEVDDALKGKGIGKQLLGKLVEFVREEKIKLMPLCPFADATFQKTKEWQDVLF